MQPDTIPCSPNEEKIVLYQPVTLTVVINTIKYPSGVYTPQFQSSEGVYYKAPTFIIFNKAPLEGGIFIPYHTSKIKKWSVWAKSQNWQLAETSAMLKGFFDPLPYKKIP
jgi:hypothetical protein